MKELAAGQFKARCLAVMDQVQESGEPVVITKRGKPVVKVVPVRNDEDDLFGFLIGRARIVGDIMHTTPPEEWEPE